MYWMLKARKSLDVVASVVGPDINKVGPYVSARTQLLAQRPKLFFSAFKVLVNKLTPEQRESCKKRWVMVTKPVSIGLRGDNCI